MRYFIMKSSFCFLLLIGSISVALGVDLTIEDGATGSDVVRASVAKIESSGLFLSDKRLLRRIAYVESRDGDILPSQSVGGIWRVPVGTFENLQLILPPATGDDISAAFASEFLLSGIDGWESLEWEDLDRPIWSALVARLAIRVTEPIPTSSDISGQASFWSRYYSTNGDVSKFIADIQELETEESKSYSCFLIVFMF